MERDDDAFFLLSTRAVSTFSGSERVDEIQHISCINDGFSGILIERHFTPRNLESTRTGKFVLFL